MSEELPDHNRFSYVTGSVRPQRSNPVYVKPYCKNIITMSVIFFFFLSEISLFSDSGLWFLHTCVKKSSWITSVVGKLCEYILESICSAILLFNRQKIT
jgi:hypothetical protein